MAFMRDDVQHVAVVAVTLGGDVLKIVFELLGIEMPDKDFSGFGVPAVGGIAAGHGDFIEVALELDAGLVDEGLVVAFGYNRGGLGQIPEVGWFQVGVNNDVAF